MWVEKLICATRARVSVAAFGAAKIIQATGVEIVWAIVCGRFKQNTHVVILFAAAEPFPNMPGLHEFTIHGICVFFEKLGMEIVKYVKDFG